MSFRTKELLETWVAEFRELGYPVEGDLRVIQQDGEDGENTGLVAIQLGNITTDAYVQPLRIGDPRWIITFEAREDPVERTAVQVHRLSVELSVLSALCSFLEAKSFAYVDTHALH